MPIFSFRALTGATLDYLLAHPLAQGALLLTAGLVVWALARAIRREARRRAVRQEVLLLAVRHPPRLNR